MTENKSKIIRSEEQQDRATAIYDSLRDELLKRDLSNTQSYDKAIITLSATSLGVSLTAIKFIVPIETAEYIWLIKFGWLLLLLSIIVTIIAFRLGNKALKNQQKKAEDYYINCKADAFERKNTAEKVNDVLNIATGIFFILAITSIVLFVILNIDSKRENMNKENDNKTNPAILRESTNVPEMPKAPEGTTIAPATESANTPPMDRIQGELETVNNSSNIPKMEVAPQSPVAPKAPEKPTEPQQTSNSSTSEDTSTLEK